MNKHLPIKIRTNKNKQQMKNKVIVAMLLCSFSANAQTTHVRLTHYHPVPRECDKNPRVTSDGSVIDMRKLKAKKLKWCAVSRDLLCLFKKDKPKRIWIEGHGIFEVRDVTHRRLKHTVDILQHPEDTGDIFGKRVKIKIV